VIKQIKRLIGYIAGRRIFAALLAIMIASGVIASVNLYSIQSGYQSASEEYDELRDISPVVVAPVAEDAISPDMDLREINPSYVCWIKIDGTEVDYPVVQGKDNEYYMYRTFRGEKNASGTPFMDVLCPGGLSSPLAIIYGHNMHDGTMFAALHNYEKSDYFYDHPDITIIPYEEEPRTYRVFAVKLTDVYDPIFELRGADYQSVYSYCSDIGKPEGSGAVLILSTCTTGGSDDERLLVFAAQI